MMKNAIYKNTERPASIAVITPSTIGRENPYSSPPSSSSISSSSSTNIRNVNIVTRSNHRNERNLSDEREDDNGHSRLTSTSNIFSPSVSRSNQALQRRNQTNSVRHNDCPECSRHGYYMHLRFHDDCIAKHTRSHGLHPWHPYNRSHPRHHRVPIPTLDPVDQPEHIFDHPDIPIIPDPDPVIPFPITHQSVDVIPVTVSDSELSIFERNKNTARFIVIATVFYMLVGLLLSNPPYVVREDRPTPPSMLFGNICCEVLPIGLFDGAAEFESVPRKPGLITANHKIPQRLRNSTYLFNGSRYVYVRTSTPYSPHHYDSGPISAHSLDQDDVLGAGAHPVPQHPVFFSGNNSIFEDDCLSCGRSIYRNSSLSDICSLNYHQETIQSNSNICDMSDEISSSVSPSAGTLYSVRPVSVVELLLIIFLFLQKLIMLSMETIIRRFPH